MMNAIFDKTIDSLSKTHPDLLTGKGLSRLLWSCMGRNSKTRRKDWITCKEVLLPAVYYGLIGLEADPMNMELAQRFMADPKGWAQNAPEGVKEGAQWYADLGDLFAKSQSGGMAQGMAEIILYHMIRDNVQELQRKNKISSIVGMKTVELLNGSCQVHKFCDQLDLVGDDEALLAEDAKKVCKLFVDEISSSEMYRYFREENSGELTPIEFGEIYDATLNPSEASIYTEIHKWVPSDDGGWISSGESEHDPIKDPTEIHFNVDSESFVLLHKDKERSPCVANLSNES